MTSFEKEVLERLTRIEERLKNDHTYLHGNGKPGLLEKVSNITTRIERLEIKEKERSKNTGVIAGIIGFLINAAIALWAALKNNQ